jgi:kynurenine 3-monooxygenase
MVSRQWGWVEVHKFTTASPKIKFATTQRSPYEIALIWNFSMEQVQTSQMPASGYTRTIVVVGAGPTGALVALYLAQMGWKVFVYERRKAEPELFGPRRSYNVVLNDRGLKALQQAGVELPPDKGVVLQGNVRHTAKGAKFSPGFANSVSIDRHTLAQYLIEEGKKHFPQQIQYAFQHTLVRVDFEEKIAWFSIQSRTEAGAEAGEHQQKFDLLIGADGAFSQVREEMVQHIAGFEVEQNWDNMMFKICQLGSAANLANAPENATENTQENTTAVWANCFHTWPSAQPITLLAPPNVDGSLSGVLILPETGAITYDQLQTEEAIATLFAQKFPDIFPALEQQGLPPGFAADLLAQKVSYGGITTICTRFDGDDRVVLLGDAAHSIWASLGQGCNAALESCRIFAEVLAAAQGDFAVALPTYTQARKPDTDGIAHLSEIGFGGNKRAGNYLFFAKILILMFLNKLFPKRFQKFALFQIANAEVPYSQIWQQVQIQNQQLRIVLMGLIVILAIITITICNVLNWDSWKILKA